MAKVMSRGWTLDQAARKSGMGELTVEPGPPSLPPILPSIRVFSNESTFRMRWPKYWSFSFTISPSNDYSGLISFRTDWLDLLAVGGVPHSGPQQ